MNELFDESPDHLPATFELRAVSPFVEMGAYEAMWQDKNASFKTLAEKFNQNQGCFPSNFVDRKVALDHANHVKSKFNTAGILRFNVSIHRTSEYPMKLRDARYPAELLYYQGILDLAHSRCVAVVGTRKPSDDGILRTKSVVRRLVKNDFTVVSGLAAGIDQVAHETAIELNGRTIAVIGTPLSYSYPKENKELQHTIGKKFLLICQVPLQRYESQHYMINRFFFLDRNVTMSAISEATIIVEAGNTSGTLTQAREALKQGRKLFILNNCFENSELSWPSRLEKKGAIRVRSYTDIEQYLE